MATAREPVNRPDSYQRLPRATPKSHLRTAAGTYIGIQETTVTAVNHVRKDLACRQPEVETLGSVANIEPQPFGFVCTRVG